MTGRRPPELFLAVLLLCVLASLSAFAQTVPPGKQNVLPNGGPVRPQFMRQPRDMWAPADVDAAIPPVQGEACSKPDVLAGAGARIEELVGNLDRFTATETVQHQSVSGARRLSKPETRKFDYLVSIGPGRGGYLNVREYRSNSSGGLFVDAVSTEGTPSLVLVFHPLYAKDFEMKCEGLGSWHGQPAWQVRFEQRSGRENRLSNVVVKNKTYSVRLRGRAWILADSYQVARLETDLAEAIPSIQLRLEHLEVEYRPVSFAAHNTELWLPATTNLYLDFGGHRFYRKHTFGNYTLFSVEVSQQLTVRSLPAE